MSNRYISRPHTSIIIEDEAEKKQSRSVFLALRYREAEMEREHRRQINNTCPHCYFTIPTIGICDECGYVQSKHIMK